MATYPVIHSERIIEFRAWSPKWKRMIYHGTDGCTIDVHANTAWLDACDDEGVALMQFTTLRDVNKQKIYVGDLFQCMSGDKTQMMQGEVFFKDGCCQVKYGYQEATKDQRKDYFLSGVITADLAEKIEVIGNIYETAH